MKRYLGRTGTALALGAVLAAGVLSCMQTVYGTDEPVQAADQLTIPDLFSDIGENGSEDSVLFEYTPLTRIPRYYNLANEGKKPTVRSQGELGTCWAISACSAVESGLLPQKKYLFSPDHMSLGNGYSSVQADGGDYYMIMSYLAGWKGPVNEADDPYGDGETTEGLSAEVHVKEIRFLREMPRQRIKQMILTYGAAQSSLAMDRTRTDSDEYHYYNEETASYYDPFVEELNHDILILGWDDTYSASNFRIRPRSDGAWICQNTWGEDFGDDGIFYVSYEDRNLFRKGGLVYDRISEASDTEKIYEQDSLGWLGRQGYNNSCCWFAGVFEAGRDEKITGIGFYTTGPYTAFRLCMIPDYTDSEDLTEAAYPGPDSSTRILTAGQISEPGFHTIDIPGEVMLRTGQKYAIAVWVDTPGEGKPAAVEAAKDCYTQTVTTEGRQTYLSSTGEKWENTQEAYGTNVCLKVYTVERELPG